MAPELCGYQSNGESGALTTLPGLMLGYWEEVFCFVFCLSCCLFNNSIFIRKSKEIIQGRYISILTTSSLVSSYICLTSKSQRSGVIAFPEAPRLVAEVPQRG